MLQVKLDKTQFDRIAADVESRFAKVIASREMKEKISDLVIGDIQKQTRAGKSITDNSSLPPLSSAWKKRRAVIAQSIKTGEGFSPNKSNLTLSGQLLESLKARFSARTISIAPEGIHKPYRVTGRNGKRSTLGRAIPNKQLAVYLEEKGFGFIGLRPEINNRIRLLVQDQVRREFR